MPCLFLRNVPKDFSFDTDAVRELHSELNEADGANLGSSKFEVHVETTSYTLLKPNGFTEKARNVHVFVEGHEKSIEVKKAIAKAVHRFLWYHGLGVDTDITFRDSPSETFFLNGELVEGGAPR